MILTNKLNIYVSDLQLNFYEDDQQAVPTIASRNEKL